MRAIRALALVATLALAAAAAPLSAADATFAMLNGGGAAASGRQAQVKLDMPPIKLARDDALAVRRHAAAEVGFEAAATVLLHESLFHKLVASVLPAVIADARKLVIPGEKQKHFSFDEIKLSAFDIGSFTIGFASPDQVVIELTGLTLAVPSTHFDVFDKILFVKATCGGNFDVSVADTSVRVTFDLTESEGHLLVSDGVATVTFGSLDVHHHFDSFLCRVGQDIIQLFIGNIDSLIRNLVEKDISPIATKAINAIFAKMAAKVSIPLVGPPVATSDSIQLSLNLLPPGSAHHAAPKKMMHGHRRAQLVQPQQPVRVRGAFPSRDIEVFVTQATANSLLQHFQEIGHLNMHDILHVNTSIFRTLLPAAYDACPDCPLEITTMFPQAPAAGFAGESATLDFQNLVAGLSGVGHNGSVALLDLNLNGTFGLDNWTVTGANSDVIDFKLSIPTFTMSLHRSAIGPVDVAALQGLIDFVLKDVVVPDFNKKFAGFPIPPIANVSVVDLELSFAGSADVGLNIVVPTL